MMIRQLLQDARQQLTPITENPQLEAEILFAYALQQSRSYLHTQADKLISIEEAERFAHYLSRRCHREPIAYITGSREFWSLELNVNKETLIPRPETELLVERVLAFFPNKAEKIKAVDLGTGSGAIAIALGHERPNWQIYATDISENTLQIARKNAQRLAVKNISFLQGDWCQALASFTADFDVVVSNPPYIAEAEWGAYAEGLVFEPRSALIAGKAGLDAIDIISRQAQSYLKPGGYVIVEHGFLQGSAVREIFKDLGYIDIVTARDLSGHERATIGRFIGIAVKLGLQLISG
jgi:release factor glutamine methyltransferase